MKNCCLWINGKKISDWKDIKENFNISDIRGYYLGGRLADWLFAHGADEKAEMVLSIDKDTNPDKALYEIFCAEYVTPQYHKGISVNDNNGIHSTVCVSSQSIKSSFKNSSFNVNGSYRVSSGSFFYRLNNNNNNNNRGSFGRTSYRLGSFGISSFKVGSFGISSFKVGSFSTESLLKASGGSFSYDDFVNCYGFDEKQLLVYFTSEPLNKYGYGIHLI